MPIYEYQCEKCEEVFEVFQKVSDPPPKKHSCGSRKVKRLMSQTSFILKGTGWYVTDYGRKGNNGNGNGNGNGKGNGKETGNGKGKEKSSESTKPAETKPSGEKSEKKSSAANAAA